ncbi:hypothetical protein C0995_015325 [Termitomyces sp. Mi166|nr:hypothetical protein C0995_015325 [Termitomyces sp. Mi166\
MPRMVPPPPAPIHRRDNMLRPVNQPIQCQADLEEDFNGLNPQNDIPPEEELENINAAFDQIVENALEFLEQLADNGDDPAVHIPTEVKPPLDPSIPEIVQQLEHD